MSALPQTEQSPLPAPDEHTAAYWEALARGELVLQECGVCRARTHPAALECRVCESTQLSWRPVPARGRLWSWVIEVRSIIAGFTPPYVVGLITPDGCDEGTVRLMGTVLVDDPSTLQIDAPLRLVVRDAPGTSVKIGCWELDA